MGTAAIYRSVTDRKMGVEVTVLTNVFYHPIIMRVDLECPSDTSVLDRIGKVIDLNTVTQVSWVIISPKVHVISK